MGLLDDLNDSNKLAKKNSMRCAMCEILSRLTADEQKALNEALANPDASKANIARILTSNGYKVSQSSVTRHARRECLGLSR